MRHGDDRWLIVNRQDENRHHLAGQQVPTGITDIEVQQLRHGLAADLTVSHKPKHVNRYVSIQVKPKVIQ